MADLTVAIVTPEREVYNGPAADVRAPGWEGEFDVLPGHERYLSLLRGGLVSLVAPDGPRRWVVGRGFAEVGDDKVVILVDRCETAEQIDKAAVQADLEAAEKALAEGIEGSAAWEANAEKREVALARLFA